MAGEIEGFDAAEFVTEMTAVMVMGLPNQAADKPTFGWDQAKTYTRATADGRPINWDDAAASSETLRTPVQATCTVELLDSAGNPIETSIGNFNPDQARLTFLAKEWAKVEDFDWVTLGDSTYRWEKRLPTLALGPVDVIQVLVGARDEA